MLRALRSAKHGVSSILIYLICAECWTPCLFELKLLWKNIWNVKYHIFTYKGD